MSRFRIPTRVAPSPAAGEPGLQNAAARLRSSRAAQARLLEERRHAVTDDASECLDPLPTVEPADPTGIPGKREEQKAGVHHRRPPAKPATEIAREKLVVLYRLPWLLEPGVTAIAARDAVTEEYVLHAVAKEGRKQLRELTGEGDVAALIADMTALGTCESGLKTMGNPMTVYVQPAALEAMHRAAGDPWRVLPRATVVGRYFTAIVVRLIKARQAG